MKNFSIYLFIAALATLSSCNKTHNASWVSSVDSTITDVKATQLMLDSIELKKLESYASIYKSLQKEALPYYKEEDREIWKNDLAELQFCAKVAPRYVAEAESILRDLDESLKQLETLKHDLEHNLVEDEKKETYVITEKQAADFVIKRALKRGKRALTCYANFESIMEKSKSTIETIKE